MGHSGKLSIWKEFSFYLFFRSAFFWFAQDERSAVRAANPTMAVGEIAKEMGRRWAEVSPERKAKYESMAETDRERFDLTW